MKYCQSSEPCPNRVLCNGYYECKLIGYCDFQRPRDSRQFSVYDPLREGYTPIPNCTIKYNIKPPQGGTGEIKSR